MQIQTLEQQSFIPEKSMSALPDSNDNERSFGWYMDRLNLSGAKLAKKFEVTEWTISRWRNHDCAPKVVLMYLELVHQNRKLLGMELLCDCHV